jgi:hypothetical protein
MLILIRITGNVGSKMNILFLILILILNLFTFEALAASSINTEELREKAVKNASRIELVLTPICRKNEMQSYLCQAAKEECEQLSIANPSIVISACAGRNVNTVMSLLEFCNMDSTCLTQQTNKSGVITNMAQLPANYNAGYNLCEPIYRLKSRNEALNNLKNELSAIDPLAAHVYDYVSLIDCIITASK